MSIDSADSRSHSLAALFAFAHAPLGLRPESSGIRKGRRFQLNCRNLLLFSTIVLALASPAGAGIRYVNAALGSGANDGTSWANAFQGSSGLQVALAVAVTGDQIWVAQGRYEPTTGNDRLVSFLLRNGVELYGGFAGTESSLSQRDFVANLTVLSGDLNGDDGLPYHWSDNSYHVVDGTGTHASAVLDGFRVRGGNANGTGPYQERGGGIFCLGGATPVVRNCVFRENRATFSGGAGCLQGASPKFVDCRFESNLGGSGGGALFILFDNSPEFLRCVFSGNTSSYPGTAIRMNSNCTAILTNCVICNNIGTGEPGGPALAVSNSNPVIRQCIVAGNHSIAPGHFGPAGIVAEPPIELVNDIIYFNGFGNPLENVIGGNCTYCCVQGIGHLNGNISANPLFVNLAAGDLHLSQYSPCADAGDNFSVPAGTTTDLDGNPRLADDPVVPDTGVATAPIVDIGAYELPNTLYSPFCAGDGSLATACPCGNTGAAGRGCQNSDIFSPGALLGVSGTASPDTVVLTSSGMLATSSCVFLQGDQQVASGVLFGDGVRCVGGSLKRLYVKSASDGTASAPGPGDPSISARSAALGDPIAPGSRRYYQVYYRDSNLAFCPAPQGDSWNVSSGLILNW